MNPIILYSHEGRNTAFAASRAASFLRCPKAVVAKNPDLTPYDLIIMVMPIMGDEELHPEMERYLLGLQTRDKQYCLCELGNFLGLAYTGCREIAEHLLQKLGWTPRVCHSIDSFPELDQPALRKWIDELIALRHLH